MNKCQPKGGICGHHKQERGREAGEQVNKNVLDAYATEHAQHTRSTPLRWAATYEGSLCNSCELPQATMAAHAETFVYCLLKGSETRASTVPATVEA